MYLSAKRMCSTAIECHFFNISQSQNFSICCKKKKTFAFCTPSTLRSWANSPMSISSPVPFVWVQVKTWKTSFSLWPAKEHSAGSKAPRDQYCLTTSLVTCRAQPPSVPHFLVPLEKHKVKLMEEILSLCLALVRPHLKFCTQCWALQPDFAQYYLTMITANILR